MQVVSFGPHNSHAATASGWRGGVHPVGRLRAACEGLACRAGSIAGDPVILADNRLVIPHLCREKREIAREAAVEAVRVVRCAESLRIIANVRRRQILGDHDVVLVRLPGAIQRRIGGGREVVDEHPVRVAVARQREAVERPHLNTGGAGLCESQFILVADAIEFCEGCGHGLNSGLKRLLCYTKKG